MRLRTLAFVPLGWVLLLAATVVVTDGAAQSVAFRCAIEGGKLLALAGCLAAASAFEGGEYMRRAWLLHGASYALLLARDAFYLPATSSTFWLALRRDDLEAGVVLLANGAAVASTVFMARAWEVAGLEHPGPVARRRLLVVVAVSVALAITAPSAALHLRDLTRGDLETLVPLASDAGDVLSMSLLAPVLFTAFAVREGLLRYPWGLFAASLLSWLLYDAAVVVAAHAPASPVTMRLAQEVCRGLACTFAFVAGLAQLAVLRRADKRDMLTLP